MKRRIIWGLFLTIIMLFIIGCGKNKNDSGLEQPDTFLSEKVLCTDTSYEWSFLPWYTSKETVQEKMSSYTKKTDMNDVEIYWADGECKNGVPVKEQISLGYKNAGTSMELAGVQVMVFLEKEEDAKELMESWKGKLEEWKGEDGVRMSRGDTQIQLRKEDSGSYIAVNYYPMVSEERSQEFPEVTWETYSAVSVYLWLPEKRI